MIGKGLMSEVLGLLSPCIIGADFLCRKLDIRGVIGAEYARLLKKNEEDVRKRALLSLGACMLKSAGRHRDLLDSVSAALHNTADPDELLGECFIAACSPEEKEEWGIDALLFGAGFVESKKKVMKFAGVLCSTPKLSVLDSQRISEIVEAFFPCLSDFALACSMKVSRSGQQKEESFSGYMASMTETVMARSKEVAVVHVLAMVSYLSYLQEFKSIVMGEGDTSALIHVIAELSAPKYDAMFGGSPHLLQISLACRDILTRHG